jgi:hypothetical protein
MPVRPEFRKFYGRIWRHATRMRILARAGHCCERCGKPNSRRLSKSKGHWERVETVSGKLFGKPVMFWRHSGRQSGIRGKYSPWRSNDGTITTHYFVKSLGWKVRLIRVVIAVVHLNHTPGDDRDDNMGALCQWCHLVNDRGHHAETRATRKDCGRPLLGRMAG